MCITAMNCKSLNKWDKKFLAILDSLDNSEDSYDQFKDFPFILDQISAMVRGYA